MGLEVVTFGGVGHDETELMFFYYCFLQRWRMLSYTMVVPDHDMKKRALLLPSICKFN